MPTALQTKAGELLETRNRLNTYFEKKTADGRFDWTAAERDEVKGLNDKANALGTELEGLQADERMEQKNRESLEALNTFRTPGSFETKSGRRVTGRIGTDGTALPDDYGIGHRFIEHKGFTGRGGAKQFGVTIPDFEVKTLFQRSAGFDPFVTRSPLIVMSAQQAPRVVDLIPTSETSQQAIKWMLETTFTNAADATAEGGTYPEGALRYVEQLSAVQKVSVFLPVTDEQLDDEPRVRDLLNNRLELMIRQKLDMLLLSGNGTAPQIQGMLGVTGIQTQAKGTDPSPSAIFKAMTLIKTVAFAMPSGALFNPTDWQNIKLLQTADGLYIWGHPSADTPNRIWGLPVVDTTYQTLGTALVGDYVNYTELVWRKGVEFLVSNSHSDWFAKGQQAIRGDIRVAFLVTRPAALCKVTGL